MSIPTENNQELPVQETQQSDKEKNLVLQRKMYERQLQEERASKLELEKRLSELESQRRSTKERDADDDDDGEPYVDKKALKKHLERLTRDIGQDIDKRAEEKARSLLAEERQHNFVRSNPDFNQILNPELIQKFADKHPEIAEQMLEMPDNFARQKLLYQNIKALGLHKPQENKPSIQDTIDKNRRSPYYRPTDSGATPPYAGTGDFSKSGQANSYKKMQELIAGRRG